MDGQIPPGWMKHNKYSDKPYHLPLGYFSSYLLVGIICNGDSCSPPMFEPVPTIQPSSVQLDRMPLLQPLGPLQAFFSGLTGTRSGHLSHSAGMEGLHHKRYVLPYKLSAGASRLSFFLKHQKGPSTGGGLGISIGG